MASKQVIFGDRITGISVHNGLVRIDLATIAGSAKNKDGQDGFKLDVTHQLVLPLDGFLAGVSMQQKLVGEIQSRLPKRDPKTEAKPAA
jgi:hypothetical protein